MPRVVAEKSEVRERVLILAPVGRDGALAAAALGESGLLAHICPDIESVCHELAEGAGVLLLTQEALPPTSVDRLLAILKDQPPWSDLPLVVLLSGGIATPAVARLTAQLNDRANVTFLERPVRSTTLVSAIRVALRARRRQYDFAELLQQRTRAEEAERQARAVAEEAVRIRDEFLASVAHDLKNPLGSIKGYAQLLGRQARRADVSETNKLSQGLARIEDAADRMAAQIDELLDLARLQSDQPLPLEPHATDLVALVRRVVAAFAPPGRSGQIQLDIAPPDLVGNWDPARLERAIGNLISNALKYSPTDQEIRIVVEKADRGGEVQARVVVRDQGIGIPEEDLPRVFERFFRARNAVGRAQGSGLGLAGVRRIVEQHGGTIGVTSAEGQGSTFTIVLPLDNGAATQPPLPGVHG